MCHGHLTQKTSDYASDKQLCMQYTVLSDYIRLIDLTWSYMILSPITPCISMLICKRFGFQRVLFFLACEQHCFLFFTKFDQAISRDFNRLRPICCHVTTWWVVLLHPCCPLLPWRLAWHLSRPGESAWTRWSVEPPRRWLVPWKTAAVGKKRTTGPFGSKLELPASSLEVCGCNRFKTFCSMGSTSLLAASVKDFLRLFAAWEVKQGLWFHVISWASIASHLKYHDILCYFSTFSCLNIQKKHRSYTHKVNFLNLWSFHLWVLVWFWSTQKKIPDWSARLHGTIGQSNSLMKHHLVWPAHPIVHPTNESIHKT